MKTKHNLLCFLYLCLPLVPPALGTNQVGAPAKRQPPLFVLVPGAWHGGWCWQRVSSRLRATGARVYTPTLSGLGEAKATLQAGINLRTHIADVVNLLVREDLHDVVLVGHSYAGTVIAGVADQVPKRLRPLVFLDAMLVENGQSALSVQLPVDQVALTKAATRNQGRNVPPPPAAAFGLTDPTDVRWVQARLRPQPFRSFTQLQVLRHPFGNHLPLVYIACTAPELPIVKKFSARTLTDKRWQHYSLPTAHDAMLTKPAEVAALLEKISY